MFDFKNIEDLVQAYITKNFKEPIIILPPSYLAAAGSVVAVPVSRDPDEIDFIELRAQELKETFSEMLLHFIKESGEKNSTVYTRANIDRRHFSKIANNPDYKPSKQTVLAFAIALKLDFEKTRDLLAVAGFTLSKANLADVIVSFFIEYKIFDVDLVNQILYKYNQPLLGG